MTEKDHPSFEPQPNESPRSDPQTSPEITRKEQLDQIRGMELLDEETRAKLPPLYATEEDGLKTLAQVKYFTPDAQWTWYASEGQEVDEDGYPDTDKEKVDYLFYGMVAGFEVEFGYFSLAELETATGPMGLPIERDLYYEPKSLQELKDWHEKQR